jgi:hypothetical protein
MRLSEVFLRLASALVAWMLIYAYVIWLAALHAIGCGPDGDEIFRLLLGMAPLALGSAMLLRVTRSFPEIHSILRWLALPLLVFLPFVLRNVWTIVQTVNIDRGPLCGQATAGGWQPYWAPVQLIVIGFCAWMIASMWRSVRTDKL